MDRLLWALALGAFIYEIRTGWQQWQRQHKLDVPDGLASAPCECRPGCEQRWVWEWTA